MKLAVIADIHGNFQALQAVLEDIRQQQVDRIISLGDNIGYGPEPEEVVQKIRELKIQSVMGNHEQGLCSEKSKKRFNPVAVESLQRTRELLSKDSLDWLAGLPACYIWNNTRFVHGCPPASITTYLFNPNTKFLCNMFRLYAEPLCFAGHTHTVQCFSDQVPGAVEIGKNEFELHRSQRYLVVVGSVGQPRDEISWQAKYIIWDMDMHSLSLRAVDYDVESTIRLIHERGFPISNARRLKW